MYELSAANIFLVHSTTHLIYITNWMLSLNVAQSIGEDPSIGGDIFVWWRFWFQEYSSKKNWAFMWIFYFRSFWNYFKNFVNPLMKLSWSYTNLTLTPLRRKVSFWDIFVCVLDFFYLNIKIRRPNLLLFS